MFWRVETQEEAKALEELLTASDRAVGIIAATFVEARLRKALIRRLVENKKINDKIYHFSAPLGAFSTKIDLGHMIGIYGETSWRDLITIKDIRNDFAHEPFATSFEDTSIKARCFNLQVIDKYIFQYGTKPDENLRSNLAVEDLAAVKVSAKLRYITACQFFSAMFHAIGNDGTKLDVDPAF